jgi:hypothetical protein
MGKKNILKHKNLESLNKGPTFIKWIWKESKIWINKYLNMILFNVWVDLTYFFFLFLTFVNAIWFVEFHKTLMIPQFLPPLLNVHKKKSCLFPLPKFITFLVKWDKID